jgi:hypothetical protein
MNVYQTHHSVSANRERVDRLALLFVLAAVLFEAIVVTVPGVRVGVQLYPHDGIAGVLLIGALARIARNRPTAVQFLILGALGCFVLSLVTGATRFGLDKAGNEARPFAYFLFAALFFSTVEFSDRFAAFTQRILFGIASLLVLLTCFRWAATLAGLGIAEQWSEFLIDNPIRVINAAQTLLLAEVAILGAGLELTGRATPLVRRLTWVMLAFVLVLQHRSVWMATFAGLAWLGLHIRQTRSRFWASLAGGALVAVVLAFLLFPSQAEKLGELLTESVTKTTEQRSTWAWRVEGWNDLLFDRPGVGAVEWLVGEPFGTGYQRKIGRELVEASPHNFYLQIVLRLGLAGLACIVVTYGMKIAEFLRRPISAEDCDRQPVSMHALQALLVMQVVMFIPYGPSIEQGMLLGVVLAATKAGQWSSGTARAREKPRTSEYQPDPRGPRAARTGALRHCPAPGPARRITGL